MCPWQVLPDDRPHVDLVLRRLKKIRDAQDGSDGTDTPKAAGAATASNSASEPAQAQRSGSTGKPLHKLCCDNVTDRMGLFQCPTWQIQLALAAVVVSERSWTSWL